MSWLAGLENRLKQILQRSSDSFPILKTTGKMDLKVKTLFLSSFLILTSFTGIQVLVSFIKGCSGSTKNSGIAET